MKKFILPKIIILLCFILLVPFFSDKVYAQDKEPLNCEQLIKILGSEKCAPWVMTDYNVWCAQTEGELLRYYSDEYGNPGMEHLYRNRAPDYTVDRSITLEELNACGANSAEGQVGNAKGNSQNSETGQPANQGEQSKDSDPAQALNDWIKDTFGELIPQAESLLDNAPAESDLQQISVPEKLPQTPLTGKITELDGNADMQLADGTWVELKAGDFMPAGAKVFTGFGVRTELRLSDSQLIILDSLEEFSLELFQTNPEAYRKELKLESGALRFKVEEGTIKTDMKVSTPNASGSVVGTDFGVKYDKKSGVSIFEIYDGTIEVQDNTTGKKKTLSSSYGSPIKRLEIAKDGAIVEKIVAPKNQSNMKIPVWIYFGAAVLVVGGLAFLKWRKRKASGSRR